MALSSANHQDSTAPSAYQRLTTHFRRLSALEDGLGLLHWDAAVMMPDGAAPGRGARLATLSALHHEMLTAPQMADWLADAVDSPDAANPWAQANIAEMHRAWVHAAAVPSDLVEALSLASSECERTWRTARTTSDFAAVRPKLEALLSLIRDSAQAKAEALGVSPYDALLDQYEPGGRSTDIDALFTDLEGFLPGFLQQVTEAQGKAPPPLAGPFQQSRQEALARRLMESVGFDFAYGRLDTSAHPFCGGTADDVRITTRYDENDFTTAMMGVLHETGHGLYERGLPEDWRDQPVGRARGMSIHESQSLLMEMQACRSPEFLRFAAPLYREAFAAEGEDWSADVFHARAIRVEPGYIRVDADEVTYPAHVILRYRLEKDMVEGRLSVADLPEAWNSGFTRLLGLKVPEHRLGCMQDIHWYDGAFGYFPTYTLGAMTAAQLFEAAVKAVPEIPAAIGRGDFGPLLGWLRPNVHAKASLMSTPQLLTEATGQPLDVDVFKRHLKRRYLGE